MAKSAYVGVDGVAHKVKKIYTGVETEIAVPKELHFPNDFNESVVSLISDLDGEIITDTVNTSGFYYSGSKIYLRPFDTLDASQLILARYSGETIKILKISFDVIQSPILSGNSSSDPAYVIILDNQKEYLRQEVVSVPMHIELEETLTSNQENPVRIGIGDYGASSYDQQAIIDNFVVELEDITESSTQSVARKVKKGYVGVGGVARPFFSAEAGLEYYGAIDPLSEARYYLAATTVGDYALFGGGSSPSLSYSDTVDAYDTSLVRSTPTVLSVGRQQLAATTVGNYALFGGGSGTSAKKKDTVDAYDTTLVRSTPTVLSEARYSLAATTVGNHALFGGGYNGWDTVDAYDTTLVRITPTVLSETRYSLAATTVGDYALFGGGTEGLDTFKDTVDAYHVSLTRSTPTVLSVGRYLLTATTVGDYALFGGGNVELTTNKDTVDAYNSSLTRSTPTVLSVARYYLSATTVGNYALFGGGNGGDLFTMISKDTVDAYNSSLTRSTPTVLSLERFALNSTTIGDYALFGGGWGDEPKYKDTVDAYYQEGAQYVTLTFEFTNKDYGFNSGFPEGSDIYLCYAEDPSAVGAIDNKFSRVINSMLEEQPPLTVRVKKGKTLCLGFRTSESDFGRLAYLKTDVIPWTNGSGGFLAYWSQTFFSLNPKYPYNEFYCTASVVNSLAPIDPVYPDEGEDWS